MPTPTLYENEDSSVFENVPVHFQSNKIDTLYVTDRRRVDKKDGTIEYDHGRSSSLAFGSCVVEMGKDLTWEELVESSIGKKRRKSIRLRVVDVKETGRYPETPIPLINGPTGPMGDPAVVSRWNEVEEQFVDEIERRLELTPRKEAFILIHGYNYSFERAVAVWAELWHFLGREGVPILYTWPGGHGGPLGYFYDRESGEFTIYHLKGFLRALASCPNLERIHLIAHSRGADICTAALRELLIEKGPEGIQKLKVHNLVLAAPDIDQDVIFQRLVAERIGFCAKRLTLYVSPDDVIIGASNWLYSGKRRVGQMSPEDFTEKMRTLMGVVNQVHIIDSEVSPFLLHGYYYDNPEVSSDLILLLRDDRDPGEEHGRPLEMIDVNYWKIPKGYPNQEVEES